MDLMEYRIKVMSAIFAELSNAPEILGMVNNINVQFNMHLASYNYTTEGKAYMPIEIEVLTWRGRCTVIKQITPVTGMLQLEVNRIIKEIGRGVIADMRKQLKLINEITKGIEQ